MCVSWSAAAVAAVSVVLNTRLSDASFLVDHITTNLTAAVNNSVTQQDIAVSPPLPILQIGLEHILAQININTSTPGTAPPTARTAIYATSEVEALDTRDTLAACGPSQPCIDGSCCNSDGKCGFTSYNCQTTATATCISNCNAYAMCGMDSLNSATNCPLNLCCSNFGYCGTTELYCINSTATYCQEGYGNCQIVPSASCDISDATASQGRKVAYWQSGNVRWRPCNRIGPSQINTTSLTHLIFAFAAIDPTTFEIVPVDPGDLSTYRPFTDLKSSVMQTWIGIGGGGFTDPGSPTITTWSDMCSSATSRAAFISSLEDFMTTWGFQGVDLDWEYPAVASRGGQPYDTANFVSLVQEMRASWGSRFGISISIPIDFSDLMGYDVEHMQESLDFFNAMAYDLHGSWEASYLGAEVRPQTSIIDITADTQPLWFAYVNPWKINLGLAYYGRGYTLSNTSCTDIGCPYSGPNLPGPCTDSPGLLSLQEIDTLIEQKGLIPKLITDEMVKQITWDDQWMGYDDDETFTLKRQWADSKCLGGTVAWSIDFNSGVGSGDSVITTTTSGTCGPTTAGVETCTGSTFGDCCSVNGYCGSTPAYCSIELGCQASFGNCSSDGLAISVDASCGAGKTCQGSAFGNCCSSAGWCGSTDAYCGAGCQNTFGTCGS